MNALKKIFGAAALSAGGGMALYSGIGLLTGGWEAGGEYDYTSLGVGITVFSLVVAFAGYRSLKSAFNNSSSTNEDKASPSDKPDIHPM